MNCHGDAIWTLDSWEEGGAIQSISFHAGNNQLFILDFWTNHTGLIKGFGHMSSM